MYFQIIPPRLACYVHCKWLLYLLAANLLSTVKLHPDEKFSVQAWENWSKMEWNASNFSVIALIWFCLVSVLSNLMNWKSDWYLSFDINAVKKRVAQEFITCPYVVVSMISTHCYKNLYKRIQFFGCNILSIFCLSLEQMNTGSVFLDKSIYISSTIFHL